MFHTLYRLQTLDFKKQILDAYESVITWKKNLFKVPSGQSGKAFTREITRHLEEFAGGTKHQTVSMTSIMIMPALLLQKPHLKSKGKEHSNLLQQRLQQWKQGDISELLRAGRSIQNRLPNGRAKADPETMNKRLAKLVLQGNIKAALHLLDVDKSGDVLKVDTSVLSQLKEKHPEGKAILAGSLLEGPVNLVDEHVFDSIDGGKVQSACLQMTGGAGPSGLDALGLRRIACSKQFGMESANSCNAVAEVTRRLCKQNIDHTLITSLANSRIIALNKNAGIRPIGIGEVLRRLMGKVVASTLKKDVQISVGPLQTCTGLKSGSEAAVHAMREYFDTEECEGILLIDAENAFNSLNRNAALHNIRISCPEISTFILNFYRKASRLFYDGGEISSDEGTTQGDAVAMAIYALGKKNLLQPELRTRKVFFEDDGVSGGMLNEVKHCWRTLQLSGPSIGYFPNAGKTWLITKPQHYEVAKNC